MFSILNRALFWEITSFGNKFCLKMRSRLRKTLNNRFYVKFMQLEIGLFGQEIFTLSPVALLSTVAHLTVNFKKLLSDLFHSGSTLVEKESIERKARLSE